MAKPTETPFVLLYDYRCPFARNLHEHVLVAMAEGLELDVRFEPWTLSQGHVAEGAPDVWDDPAQAGALVALEASVAVRDLMPEQFAAAHGALFDARHARSIPLSTVEQVTEVLASVDIDADAVFAEVASGRPKRHIADAWTHYHDDLDVFGVPTFVVDDADATFVRLMDGPDPKDPARSVGVVTGLLELVVGNTDINELKHTRLSR